MSNREVPSNVPAADVAAIREWAKGEPLIERVWLFGSRIRGDFNSDSDLDIGVEHGTSGGDGDPMATEAFERPRWRRDVQEVVSLPIDLWGYRPGDTVRVEQSIRECSILIYEKE